MDRSDHRRTAMTPFTGPESENEITIIGDGDESKSAREA
jgi:hypothetical protein